MAGKTFDPAPVLAHYRGQTAADVAEILGVHRCTVHAWRAGRNRLQLAQADRFACKQLGVHPSALWPEWGTEEWLA